MKYTNYSDESLFEQIQMLLYAYSNDEIASEVVDEIEYINHHDGELLTEWLHRIVNHYQLKTYIRDDILMQYLYHDWNAAVTEWWLYNGLVGEMLQLYIDDLTDKLQDDWERRISC